MILFLKKLHNRQKEHSISAYSAQMAFFLMLSIFPFFIFLFTVLSRFSIDSSAIFKVLLRFFPKDAENIIIGFIKNHVILKDAKVLSFSIAGAIWSASKGVHALSASLNMAYDIKETRNFLVVKLIDMLYTIFFVFTIAIFLTIPNLGYDFFMWLKKYIFIDYRMFENFQLGKIVFLPIILVLFMAGIYMILPNEKLKFREVIWGAVFSILGWVLLSYLFTIFIKHFSNFKVVYGSLTAIIILMFWLYFSSMVLIIGGEINSIIKNMKKRS